MENLNEIKLKLIERICESHNYHLLSAFLKNIESKGSNSVSEPDAAYQSEEPMSDEEVEEYFREEEMVLPKEILEIVKISEAQIANGEFYSNEEVQKYFDEWLKK